MKKVKLIIPSFNEKDRVVKLHHQIRQYHPKLEIIIVDDGSRTPVNINHKNTSVLRHHINLGKGASLKTGVDYAIANGANQVIFMDADLQHDPKELTKFIQNLKKGYDVILGIRPLKKNAPLIRLLGNKLASYYFRYVFRITVPDILSGYRAFTSKALKRIYWNSAGYGVEAEMVARLSLSGEGLKWTTIPIKSIYIDKYKGVTILDAIKILTHSITWRLS